MTVKEYFEKYWFCNYNEEKGPDGYEMPIVKCKDGTFLVSTVILGDLHDVGCTDWLDNGSFFYCLIHSISALNDNIYNYIPDLGDYVNINKLEKLASEHGGVVVDPVILKYSFMQKILKSFTTTIDLGDIIYPDLMDLKNKYLEEIYR